MAMPCHAQTVTRTLADASRGGGKRGRRGQDAGNRATKKREAKKKVPKEQRTRGLVSDHEP